MSCLSPDASLILRCARDLLVKPDSYSHKVPIASTMGETSAGDKAACRFSITGVLEHSMALLKVRYRRGMPAALFELKSFLCLRLRAIHLDAWEIEKKPTIGDVRAMLDEAIGANKRYDLDSDPNKNYMI